LAVVVVLALAGVVLAHSVGNVDGIWSVPNPGSAAPYATCDVWATGPGDNPATTSETDPGIQSPPTNDENQVRYGGFDTCALFGGRSGFGFDGINGMDPVALNTPIALGVFTHYNRSTGSLDPFNYADLNMTVPITCNDGTTVNVTFTDRFTLDETINNAPCPYPGVKECTDKVTVTHPGNVTFTCDGQEFNLQILGFVPAEDCSGQYPGNASFDFITEEDTNDPACLWAQVNGDEPPPPDASCPNDASISLVKSVNGEDANAAPGPSIPVGSMVTYSFAVTNNGKVPLKGVIVADDKMGVVCKPGTLAPGQTVTCTKTGTAVYGQNMNRGKAGGACANDAGMKYNFKDVDFAYYMGVQDEN
jgi:hypothetical protein